MMKKRHLFLWCLTPVVLWGILSFTSQSTLASYTKANPLIPIGIDQGGYTFLKEIQGQWVGINRVAGITFDWFSFDYRPISPSHVHGIYEGGSMGNLFTSFFIADFKGKKTIMARNGGVLNGIYRTSYFVMDSIHTAKDDHYYRLVDAVGGKATMYMELRFKKDSLYWNSYTSGLGNRKTTKRHMTYKGKKFSDSLAQIAAKAVGFPKKEASYNFPNGFDNSYLYMKKSASFLAQRETNDVYQLAKESLDPVTIHDYQHIASLNVKLQQNKRIKDQNVFLNISTEPLTDMDGNFIPNTNTFNSIVLFPMLHNKEEQFEFTYVHPGTYYITAIVDVNGDMTISKGDITNVSQQIKIIPNEKHHVLLTDIDNINTVNFQPVSNQEHDTIIPEEPEHEEIPVIDRIVTYSAEVKDIVFSNCITCHGGPSPSAGLDLSNYDELLKVAKNKALIKRMNDRYDPMPPDGMLSLEDRMIVFKWLKDGLPKK